MRKARYGAKSVADFGYSDYTGKDLGVWNNYLVALLS
jgi:hypothetical protein